MDWKMAGTDGTNEYVVIAANTRGRIGIRDLGLKGGQRVYRIRVEPSSWDSGLLEEIRDILHEWCGPEGNETKGNLRFSTVEMGEIYYKNSIAQGMNALKITKSEELNPEAPDWAKDLLGVTFKPLTKPEKEKKKQEWQSAEMSEVKLKATFKSKSSSLSALAEKLKAEAEAQAKQKEEAVKAAAIAKKDATKSLLDLAAGFAAKLKKEATA